uniref:TNF superfamily member 13b n=1 Tax=Pipistrellus kuhlii TaxID=59472 RepID=A0A7J7ZND3_PIPKU|nr:TNF superfamily member 13b [Pipistrellus kuhlii]
MNDSTEGKQARLSPGLKRREEMKLKEYVPILPQKESPSARFSGDGLLLALTLLLALVSCCLTVVSFCRVAALQVELKSLREELLEHRAEQLPGPPRAGAAAPRPAVQEAPAATSALKEILAPPAAQESNFSRSIRKRRAVQGPEETVIQDCLQLIADSDMPTIRKGILFLY